jgi:hypothetical protein
MRERLKTALFWIVVAMATLLQIAPSAEAQSPFAIQSKGALTGTCFGPGLGINTVVPIIYACGDTFTWVPIVNIGSIATVATATTIAPATLLVNLTGTTAIATITTPAGFSSTVGGCLTFFPASTVATTNAGNIAAVYSLVGGKAYQGCWNGTKFYFIGSGI